MDFTAMGAREYRSLNADQFDERRSLVFSLAQEPPADATAEQLDAIDAEITVISDEMERRNKLAEARNQKAVEVIGGAGKVVTSTESEKRVSVKKDNSLGGRAWAEMQERGFNRDERFQLRLLRRYKGSRSPRQGRPLPEARPCSRRRKASRCARP